MAIVTIVNLSLAVWPALIHGHFPASSTIKTLPLTALLDSFLLSFKSLYSFLCILYILLHCPGWHRLFTLELHYEELLHHRRPFGLNSLCTHAVEQAAAHPQPIEQGFQGQEGLLVHQPAVDQW